MKIRNGLRRMGNLVARRLKCGFGRRGEEGAALLEFAITLPMLMMVLTGTASFSLGLYFLQQIGNATSSAALTVAGAAGVGLNNTDDPCAWAVSSVTSALPNLTASKLTYTLTVTDSSGTAHKYGPTTGSSFSCTAGYALEAPNEPVVLTVSYAYTWLPVLNFSPSSSLTSTEAAVAE